MNPMNPINPPHYQGHTGGAQVIDITENLTFCGGNIIKYVARATRLDGANKGNPIEDLQKARWYLEREINRLQTESNHDQQSHQRYKDELINLIRPKWANFLG